MLFLICLHFGNIAQDCTAFFFCAMAKLLVESGPSVHIHAAEFLDTPYWMRYDAEKAQTKRAKVRPIGDPQGFKHYFFQIVSLTTWEAQEAFLAHFYSCGNLFCSSKSLKDQNKVKTWPTFF